MRWQRVYLAVAFGLSLATTLRAADPEIFTGYGRTRWGQTIEEVAANYPQIKEVSRFRELKKVPLDTPATEDASGFPVDRFFAAPAAEPLSEIVFGFSDGKLYLVEIAFSAQTEERLDDLTLARLIWKKYFSTDAARAQMANRQLDIRVVSRHPKSNLANDPQEPDQLLYPNMHYYGDFNLGVYYQDRATESRAFDEAALRKQIFKEQNMQESEKAADELGVRGLL